MGSLGWQNLSRGFLEVTKVGNHCGLDDSCYRQRLPAVGELLNLLSVYYYFYVICVQLHFSYSYSVLWLVLYVSENMWRGYIVLGYIKRQFTTRKKGTILTLYNALVRQHLEYAVQFWSPSMRKDIERLEKVQARATKLIPSIRHMSYERRLAELNLYSLEKRRIRGQLIETFKILKGIENI